MWASMSGLGEAPLDLRGTNVLVHEPKPVNKTESKALAMARERKMRRMWKAGSAIAATLLIALSGGLAQAQQKTEISLSRQPGIFYMPTHIIEKQKLIEKHAAALGLSGVTTKWITFNSGGAQT